MNRAVPIVVALLTTFLGFAVIMIIITVLLPFGVMNSLPPNFCFPTKHLIQFKKGTQLRLLRRNRVGLGRLAIHQIHASNGSEEYLGETNYRTWAIPNTIDVRPSSHQGSLIAQADWFSFGTAFHVQECVVEDETTEDNHSPSSETATTFSSPSPSSEDSSSSSSYRFIHRGRIEKPATFSLREYHIFNNENGRLPTIKVKEMFENGPYVQMDVFLMDENAEYPTKTLASLKRKSPEEWIILVKEDTVPSLLDFRNIFVLVSLLSFSETK
ncbi:hypothetical protein FDP41_006388 [Naegleria fowleri]|uniref:Uncharacterized protein n=1 Tax=Naegleria fowleri TaxID=5763 RepID=A0A6A5BHY4_NAEFO|nr:uncharacterized protein FDP41_006388 [Naegleria fowleri]KAF0974356.1 hypothetical protein FDP41_006388 [Naegleria fowleri]CAG4719610.1 unnamed protein product [Naegleria fowleri]